MICSRRLFKRGKSYRDTVFNDIYNKQRWLKHALFNELYHDHPELWTWIKAKIAEYEAL